MEADMVSGWPAGRRSWPAADATCDADEAAAAEADDGGSGGGGGDGVSSEWRAVGVVTESPSSDSEPESSADALAPSPSLAELPPETLHWPNQKKDGFIFCRLVNNVNIRAASVLMLLL